MPANLSPAYKKAEQEYRAARDDQERLTYLKGMLRTIPKHKGTEHLQADIKSRIKLLTEELAGPKKGGKRSGPLHSVRKDGAAQIALLGPPNSGKSSLHAKLTGSRAEIGPYPHTTHEPMPGMLRHKDITFQLIDLPPISADHMDSWFINALQPADAALLILDIADPESIDHAAVILERLKEKKIILEEQWSMPDKNFTLEDNDRLDPFGIYLPTLLVANKYDLEPDPAALNILKELLDISFPSLVTSIRTEQGLKELGTLLFDGLEIIRVYTKAPGKAPQKDKPFTLRKGATVLDVARLVHKDIAGSLKYARAWGNGVFDGQQVGPEHPLSDTDVIELHIR
tara:strand:- start:3609 stop:4634 length:1026 start_codon:yes stop_codon:yes gene_type:complete